MLNQEEECPIGDDVLGQLYRASPEGRREILGGISPTRKAMLALYCHRRSHLAELSVTVASMCELSDLVSAGGMAGRVLYTKSQATPVVVAEKRSKITLSTGPLSHVIAQDLI